MPGLPRDDSSLAPRDVLPGVEPWEPLDHAAVPAATAGLWRAGGRIVKLLRPDRDGHPLWPASLDPRDPMWWRREADFYAAGIELAGLRAPEAEVVERRDGSVALVLPELQGAATGWPLERYGPAAYALGLTQGEFAAGRPLPDEPWLSRGWLRAYVERRRAEAAPDERLLARLDALPRTLCHLDLWPRNLFDEDGETLAIDWSFVGIGALGEDAGNLIPDAMLDGFVPAEQARELHELVVGAYVDGLRDAGWRGDHAEVELAVRLSAVVKYGWLAPRHGAGRLPGEHRRLVIAYLAQLAAGL